MPNKFTDFAVYAMNNLYRMDLFWFNVTETYDQNKFLNYYAFIGDIWCRFIKFGDNCKKNIFVFIPVLKYNKIFISACFWAM